MIAKVYLDCGAVFETEISGEWAALPREELVKKIETVLDGAGKWQRPVTFGPQAIRQPDGMIINRTVIVAGQAISAIELLTSSPASSPSSASSAQPSSPSLS